MEIDLAVIATGNERLYLLRNRGDATFGRLAWPEGTKEYDGITGLPGRHRFRRRPGFRGAADFHNAPTHFGILGNDSNMQVDSRTHLASSFGYGFSVGLGDFDRMAILIPG